MSEKKYVIADEQGYFSKCFSNMTDASQNIEDLYKSDVDDRTIYVHATPITMTQQQFDSIMGDESIAHVSDLPDELYEGGQIHIEVHPVEPECTEDQHGWKEIELHGHGAGIITVDQCVHCGLKRHQDTYAQCDQCSEQDLWAIKYVQ